MPEPIESVSRTLLEQRYRRSRMVNVLLGIVTIGLIILSAVQWSQDSSTKAAPAVSESSDDVRDEAPPFERRDAADPMAMGDPDAPVVLSEWIDFRCPYCAVFSRDTLPLVIDEYVETGMVRLEVHDVAFFGEESVRAAAAARAAGEQGRYFEFMREVYEAAPETGHAELPSDELIELAELAGVPDLERFESDMTRDDLVLAVEESTRQAQQLGVSGVPFFYSAGQGLSGAQPIEVFRQFLDSAA